MFMKNLLIAVWWCGLFNMVPVGSSCGGGYNGQKNQVEANPADGACGNVDIRNSVEGFQKLENCTVIEGKLHILLIDHAEQKDYDRFRFPLLREITGHLLLYRVYGLKTLRHIFPNLAVIRGQDLFYNYALVAYEMPDLEELGLVSLTTILRGAVRLTKNTRLCYVDTVDWSRIAVGRKESDHHIQENKDVTECVNYCPQGCPSTRVDAKEARRCWTASHCQKNLECHCGSNTSSCFAGTNRCCNKNCVGGCFGGEGGEGAGMQGQSCVACLNVVYQGKCLPRCPPTTYMFMQRRCLTSQQCRNMTRRFRSPVEKWKLYRPESTELPWECVMECPTAYQANDDDTECIKCNNSCPKVCASKVVDSIDSAQQLKGCNKIDGPLEIQIMGGSNIGLELEESLGEIREVTHYIKIVRSYALLSLHFFKSLRVIGGENEADTKASLIVRDNSNLQELFTEEVTRTLKIRKGKVKFHGNRKLCLHKIRYLVEELGLTNSTTDLDVSPTMNGDLVPCMVTKLELRIRRILRNVVILDWPKVESSDEREVLTYIINYREVTSNTVSIYQGRDACSENIWKTLEAGPEYVSAMNVALIPSLKPWTRYAAYVEAVMLSSATSQAISDILTFTTSPDYPTSPTNLKAVAEQPGELLVTWNPPKVPNGNVTHYYVYWQLQVLDQEPFDQRDYCKNPITPHKEKKMTKEEDPNKKSNSGGDHCCTCPKSKEELKEEERERQIEIEFENYLHDHVYCKRSDALPDSIDAKYSLDHLASRIKRQSDSRTPPPSAQSNSVITPTTTTTTTTTTTPAMGSNSTAAGSSLSNQTQENTYLHLTIYDTKIPLTNLGHFQEYSIEVLACQETDPKTGEKLCSNRAITVARTKPLDKADNINASTVEAKVIANSTGDVVISWEPPKQPNGLIIKYLIRYRRANQDHEFLTICVSQRKYRQLGGHRLVNIDPGNYTFKIAAVSLVGNGSYTPLMHFVISPRHETEKPLSKTLIAVAVISVIIVVVIVVVVVWFIAKNRFENLDMTVISQNPGYMPSDDLYIPDEWEVPRDKIELLKELGQGSFGMVYSGKAHHLVDGYSEYKVAIKTVNDNAGFQERMNFLKEATTMKTFDCYHVVKLIGVVSKGQPALVIMELMGHGDLKNFLRMHRPDEEDKIGDPPTVKEILQMAGEIADGMAYLSVKKFVHRDLAARNCMVSENKVVKIGDFGMTRDIYETDYYRKGNKGLLPVRWMAPESLIYGVFTTMSDVWSYGIVMWEMATLAAQPYQGLSNEQVVKFVGDGKVMEQPPGCPPKLWSLMQKCWQYRAKHRPTFMSIIDELVPDLEPSFQHVAYFFSEEGHADPKVKDGQGGTRSSAFIAAHNALRTRVQQQHDEDFLVDRIVDDDDDDDLDNIRFAGIDSPEESCVPFIAMTADDSNSTSNSNPNPQGGGHQGRSSSVGGHGAAAQHSPSSNSNHRGASSSSLSSSWARAAGASRGGGLLVEGAGAGSGSPTGECVMMEELPNGHGSNPGDSLHLPYRGVSTGCSSSPPPPRTIPTSPSSSSSSENSKGSSKGSSGSGGSFSSLPPAAYHMNGLLLVNGHIHNSNKQQQQQSPAPSTCSSQQQQRRTKPC